jgi:hypothetical protein
MSIKEYVNELNVLRQEIARNNARNKQLRGRVKELEDSITSYLNAKEQTGVKYNGQAIIIETKPKHLAKKKKEKEDDIIHFFRNLGVSDPDHAYAKLQEVQRGEAIEQQKLKFKKLPNF